MNVYMKWITTLAILLLTGCQIPAAMIAVGAGAMPAYPPPPRPNYDVPLQKIYGIDDHRYFTLENYPECGASQVYYNDTSKNIRTLVKGALSSFPGHIRIDGSSHFVVFPDSVSNGTGLCGGDRGCFLRVYYSLDEGRTFDWFHPRRLSTDRKKSYEMAKKTTITLKGQQLFLHDEDSASMYKLHKGIMGGVTIIEDGPKGVPHVRTPSGQDRIICDNSIRPKEIKK